MSRLVSLAGNEGYRGQAIALRNFDPVNVRSGSIFRPRAAAELGLFIPLNIGHAATAPPCRLRAMSDN